MRPNVALWLIFGITVSLLGITLAIEPVRELFRFGPLHGDDLMLALAGGVMTVLFLESTKAVSRSLRLGRV
jgi:Ca2+-transporting ATPase